MIIQEFVKLAQLARPATLFVGKIELEKMRRIYANFITQEGSKFFFNGILVIEVNLESYCSYVRNHDITRLDERA